MSSLSSPFVPSEVEGREAGHQRVSTSLDTNGIRGQFPGLAGNWHYLDTAATAQKPQAVIDATVNAMGVGVQHFSAQTLPELERLLTDLGVLSASLRRLTEQAERAPAGLVFGRNPSKPGPGESNEGPP